MTKAAAYLRLSKADDGHGIDVQRASLERFCERRGLELVGAHVDDGASGRSTRKRPGLAACIEAIRSAHPSRTYPLIRERSSSFARI